MSLVEKVNGHFQELYMYFRSHKVDEEDIEETELLIVRDAAKVEEAVEQAIVELKNMLPIFPYASVRTPELRDICKRVIKILEEVK